MDELLLSLISGVSNGAVYGLIGLGLVIIYRSTDVVNFAVGTIALACMYLASSLTGSGVPLALALLAGIGVRPRLWRLPWGEAAGWSAELAGAHGLALCRWSADTRDWRGDRAEAMLAAVAPLAVPGAVVLMHDGLGPGALRPGCGQTVALIGPLAELARSRGLALEPLREPSC
ncbi:MAG: peptidoglycan-N-acetylglucosamine deacetylase [Miltoncostaeaceae bacterium]|nr:peptidoglycan-N-acetylglucosamine deacetylase [Miltoncostaeaceae bacterium]